MVRRRSSCKQPKEDAMSRLAAVRCKWQDRDLPVEELTIATNLLIEASDHRVLNQLLVLLLEWVHAAPFPQALVSAPVLARLVSLLHCPAWPIQKQALQLLTAGAMNVQPEDAAQFAKLLMPPSNKFFNYISNPINCWPDNTQHMVLTQLVFMIVSPHPLCTPEPSISPPRRTKPSMTCTASEKITKRSTGHHTVRKSGGKSNKHAPSANIQDALIPQDGSMSSGAQSLFLAWEIVRNLLLCSQTPESSPGHIQTERFPHLAAKSAAAPQAILDSIQPVNCYGCNLVDDTSLKALQKSCCDDPDSAATFFALQTLQCLLRHTCFTTQVLPQHDDLVPVVIQALASNSSHVAAAAAATMCSLITHAPSSVATWTGSMHFMWCTRVLADRCVQPDQVALNALPLVHHIAHVYPAQMCYSGLVSVITKSVHAMRDCVKSTALQYLMLAMQILLEVSFFPDPLSAAALRGDVLGAALKAVKLTWHADELYSSTSGEPGIDTDKIVARFLQHIRLDAIQCVHIIRSMCNLRERPAILDRILHPMDRSDGGVTGLDASGKSHDIVEELKRSSGLNSTSSSGRESSGGSDGGWCKAGALYISLLWQAERNFSGAIAVERALAQGEGQLGEEKPFPVSALDRVHLQD